MACVGTDLLVWPERRELGWERQVGAASREAWRIMGGNRYS